MTTLAFASLILSAFSQGTLYTLNHRDRLTPANALAIRIIDDIFIDDYCIVLNDHPNW